MKPLAFLAILIGLPALVAAAAPAPAAHPLAGDEARMNVPFALDYYNFKIQSIQWVANGMPLVVKLGLPADDGSGTLVITAAVKENWNDSRNVPVPNTQLIYKDGSTSTEEPLDAYSLSGRHSDGTYQPGEGGTLYFVLADTPEPTVDNPITKIVFRQTFSDLKPPLIRLLNPPVTIVK